MVGNVNLQLAPDPIATTQIVDYRRRTPESAMALTLAVTHAAEPAPLRIRSRRPRRRR